MARHTSMNNNFLFSKIEDFTVVSCLISTFNVFLKNIYGGLMKKKLVYGLIALFALSFVFTGCDNGTTDTVYVGENLVPGIPITTQEGLNAALALKSDWTALNPQTYAVYSNADTIDYFGTAKYSPTVTAPGVEPTQTTSIVPDGVILNLSGLFRVGGTTGGAGTLAIGGEVNIWKGAEIIVGTYSSTVAGTNANGTIVIGVATVDTEEVTIMPTTGGATRAIYPKRNARGRLNVYENGALTTNGFDGGTQDMVDVTFASVYAYNTNGRDQGTFVDDKGGTSDWLLNPETRAGYTTLSSSSSPVIGDEYSDIKGNIPIRNQMVIAAFNDGTIAGSGKDSISEGDSSILIAPTEARLVLAANSYFNIGGTATNSFLRLPGSSEDSKNIANGLFKTNLIYPSTSVNLANFTVRKGTTAYVAGELTGHLAVYGKLIAGTGSHNGNIRAAQLNENLLTITVGPEGYLDATGVNEETGAENDVRPYIDQENQFNHITSLVVEANNLSYGRFIANGAGVRFTSLKELEIEGHAEINQGKFPALEKLTVKGNNSLYTGGGAGTIAAGSQTTQFWALKTLVVEGYYNAGTGTDFTERGPLGVPTSSAGNEALTSLTIGNGGYLKADGTDLTASGEGLLSNFNNVGALSVSGPVPQAYVRVFGPKRAAFPDGYPGTGGTTAITTAPGTGTQAVYPDQRSGFGVLISNSAQFGKLGSGATLSPIGGFVQLDNAGALSNLETLTVNGGVFKSENATLSNLKTVAINGKGYIYSGKASFSVASGNATGDGTLDLTGNTNAKSSINILAGSGAITKVIGTPSGSPIVITEVDIAGTTAGTWTTGNTTIGDGGKIVLGNDWTSTTEGVVQTGNTLKIEKNGSLTVSRDALLDVKDTGKITIEKGGALNISGGTVTLSGGTTNLTIGGSGSDKGVLTISGANSVFDAGTAYVVIDGGKVELVNNVPIANVNLGGNVTLTGGAILDGIGAIGNDLSWLGTASTVTVTGKATIKGKPNKTVWVAADDYTAPSGESVFIRLPVTGGSVTITDGGGTAGTINIGNVALVGALSSVDGPATLIISGPVNVTGNTTLGGTATAGSIASGGIINGGTGAQLDLKKDLNIGGGSNTFYSAIGGTLITGGTITAGNYIWADIGGSGSGPYGWYK
ncbi:hypothetical protein AGMMS50212_06720 [Spirochaetia bacterium]|nr:hypothetical protein AGMMS50212_06720 [Spirochaetia bacterium]